MSHGNNSYVRYRQYRRNRRRYNAEAKAIPLLIFLSVYAKNMKFFVWIMIGIVLLIGVCLWVQMVRNKKHIVEGEVHENMTKNEEKNMNTTDTGYINKNNQRNIGKTNQPGTDYNQQFYAMECLDCGYIYKANGSDIWLRKCPRCQGGKA